MSNFTKTCWKCMMKIPIFANVCPYCTKPT